MLLKNSPMRSALHFIEHGRCDEVTHIARSVSFDYCSESAQRDSIEGKHSFRTFKPLLNRIESAFIASNHIERMEFLCNYHRSFCEILSPVSCRVRSPNPAPVRLAVSTNDRRRLATTPMGDVCLNPGGNAFGAGGMHTNISRPTHPSARAHDR
jgi:hypothetical protein